MWVPVFECRIDDEGECCYSVGHDLVDGFLEFLGARARPNTVRAYAHDLKVFFSVVGKDPIEIVPSDVMAFITAQRRGRAGVENVVRIADGSAGLAAATIKRRLAAVSALYGYLIVMGVVAVNPVPRGMPTRRARRSGSMGVPLVRGVRRLPRIMDPDDVVVLLAALRTDRDRAIVQAMLLSGLRRSEVLGLRLEDLRLGEWRVFIADGKGGHERLVPMSATFFATVAEYLNRERPADAFTDRVFVALKGPTRGGALSASGFEEVLDGARRRAGLSHATCHELRHTCFTRLREAGMAIEAIQALAGHRSIASTRIYLHLGDEWLADEYRKASAAIDATTAAAAEGAQR